MIRVCGKGGTEQENVRASTGEDSSSLLLLAGNNQQPPVAI